MTEITVAGLVSAASAASAASASSASARPAKCRVAAGRCLGTTCAPARPPGRRGPWLPG